MERIVAALDKDSSGFLSKEEIKTLFSAVLGIKAENISDTHPVPKNHPSDEPSFLSTPLRPPLGHACRMRPLSLSLRINAPPRRRPLPGSQLLTARRQHGGWWEELRRGEEEDRPPAW